jgi:flagellar biosynthesis protein FlhG
MNVKHSVVNKPLRVISIAGGKGGIGKTTISVNLAVNFAKMGKNVLLMDADLGLANVDIMLGLKPNKTLDNVLTGECKLKDICMTGPHGLKIIPASSGMQKMTELSFAENINLIHSFSNWVEDVDVMMIDLASGISNQVMDFTNASQDILVVLCNDPSSLMDSYAVIKILRQKYSRKRFGVIVNKTKGQYEGSQVFSKFQEATEKLIDVSLHYIGHIPSDDYIAIAARERVSVVKQYPFSPSAKAMNHLCQIINQWQEDHLLSGGIHFFFERLVQCQ